MVYTIPGIPCVVYTWHVFVAKICSPGRRRGHSSRQHRRFERSGTFIGTLLKLAPVHMYVCARYVYSELVRWIFGINAQQW